VHASNVCPLLSPEVGLQASDARNRKGREGKERKGKEREGKGREGKGKERKGKKRKGKERKGKEYAFRRQLNEKANIIPGCPGDAHSIE